MKKQNKLQAEFTSCSVFTEYASYRMKRATLDCNVLPDNQDIEQTDQFKLRILQAEHRIQKSLSDITEENLQKYKKEFERKIKKKMMIKMQGLEDKLKKIWKEKESMQINNILEQKLEEEKLEEEKLQLTDIKKFKKIYKETMGAGTDIKLKYIGNANGDTSNINTSYSGSFINQDFCLNLSYKSQNHKNLLDKLSESKVKIPNIISLRID